MLEINLSVGIEKNCAVVLPVVYRIGNQVVLDIMISLTISLDKD